MSPLVWVIAASKAARANFWLLSLAGFLISCSRPISLGFSWSQGILPSPNMVQKQPEVGFQNEWEATRISQERRTGIGDPDLCVTPREGSSMGYPSGLGEASRLCAPMDMVPFLGASETLQQCSCLHRMLPSWSGISRGNLSATASFQPKYGRCSPAWILEPRELSTQILSNMKRRHAGLWLASWSFELAIRPPRTCSEWLFCVAGESSCRLTV